MHTIDVTHALVVWWTEIVDGGVMVWVHVNGREGTWIFNKNWMLNKKMNAKAVCKAARVNVHVLVVGV